MSYFRILLHFIRFHLVVILLASSFLGIALLPLTSCLRGYALSCTAATIISADSKNGLIMALLTLGIPAIFSLPCFFVMSVDGYLSSKRIFTLARGVSAIRTNGFLKSALVCMAICGKAMLSEGRLKKNAIVATVMSNLGFHKYCGCNGIDLHCASVGDRNVLEMMQEKGFNLGGEQSGHMIFLDDETTGDGQLAAVHLLEVLSQSGKKLSQMAAEIPTYPQVLRNISIEGGNEVKKAIMEDVSLKKMIEAEESTLGDSGRILVRPSGTEALIRVMALVDGVQSAQNDRNINEAKELHQAFAGRNIGGYDIQKQKRRNIEQEHPETVAPVVAERKAENAGKSEQEKRKAHVEVVDRGQTAEVNAELRYLKNGCLVYVTLRNEVFGGHRHKLYRFFLFFTHLPRLLRPDLIFRRPSGAGRGCSEEACCLWRS